MKYKEKFENRVIWIIGGSSGIGEQLACKLSSFGVKLILSSRNEKQLKAVAEKCSNGSEVRVLPVDLNESDSLVEKSRKALDLFGSVDFLFNISGVAHRDFALNTDMNVDRKLMQINYFGTIEISRLILKDMIKKGSGHIIVTSSMSGKYGVPLLSAYAASKHALHGFFESLRAEIRKENIKITIIIPGFIKTNITKNALTGDGKPFGKMLKIQDSGMPADICAEKIIEAVAKEKEEIFIGRSERFSLLFYRLFPQTFSLFIGSHPMKKFRKIKNYFFAPGKPDL